jgi:hypothetical protein
MQLRSRWKQFSLTSNETGSSHHALLLSILLAGAIFGAFRLTERHVAADSPKISSGVTGYCLDDHANNKLSGAPVDIWKCNDTAAQVWSVSGIQIKHDGTDCLAIANDGKAVGTAVVLNNCSDAPGQVWLRDKTGYENPNSTLCLASSGSASGSSLTIESCANISNATETWTPGVPNDNLDATSAPCSGSEGARVACAAEKEWTTWQSGTPDHTTLLTSYTDGAPYEEWCADFVSYVYKEAGYPFTQGEADGWDENIADNIQNMGFTEHAAGSGYIPKPGDVAYFDYSGGHVEIVVSGGTTPTFIYGNSGTIDPTTGNGEMMANTITSDGELGQLMYYLSPNN